MMTYELDDIDKAVLLGKVVERARADLNDGRPLTEMATEKKTDARIVYKRPSIDGAVYVYLDGKRVGAIRQYPRGWQYTPRGAKGGDFFATLAECKRSLESDQ